MSPSVQIKLQELEDLLKPMPGKIAIGATVLQEDDGTWSAFVMARFSDGETLFKEATGYTTPELARVEQLKILDELKIATNNASTPQLNPNLH